MRGMQRTGLITGWRFVALVGADLHRIGTTPLTYSPPCRARVSFHAAAASRIVTHGGRP